MHRFQLQFLPKISQPVDLMYHHSLTSPLVKYMVRGDGGREKNDGGCVFCCVLTCHVRHRACAYHGNPFFCPRANLPRFCLLEICFGGSHGEIHGQKKDATGKSRAKKRIRNNHPTSIFIPPLPFAAIHATAALRRRTASFGPPLSVAVCRRP